jgi:hypothetical protein
MPGSYIHEIRMVSLCAIVEPNRNTALIGAVVLEVLDFVVDCVAQKLLPRDPSGVSAEIE